MNEELTEYFNELRQSSNNALARVLYNLWWIDWPLESFEPQKEWGAEEWKKYAHYLEAEGQKLFWETVIFHKEKTDALNKLRRSKKRPKRKVPGAMMCQRYSGHKVKPHFAALHSQREITIH